MRDMSKRDNAGKVGAAAAASSAKAEVAHVLLLKDELKDEEVPFEEREWSVGGHKNIAPGARMFFFRTQGSAHGVFAMGRIAPADIPRFCRECKLQRDHVVVKPGSAVMSVPSRKGIDERWNFVYYELEFVSADKDGVLIGYERLRRDFPPGFPKAVQQSGYFLKGAELIAAMESECRRGSAIARDAPAADVPVPPAKARGGGAGFGTAADNEKVEAAAMKIAERWYQKRGWETADVSKIKEHLGYDLHCVRDGREEHVEVKGVSGDREDFLMWFTEKNNADADDDFVVFVVTEALSPRPKSHRYTRAEFVREFDLSPVQFRARRRTGG